MITLTPDTFIVFDLDDTLYKEDDYHDSGVRAVARFVKRVYGRDFTRHLFEWKRSGVVDLWSRLCEEAGICPSAKEAFLWSYRLHSPTIRLPASTKATLDAMASTCAGVAILTDGRSVTQRLKLAALGLDQYPVYISEEWQSEKPDAKRFLSIQGTYRARQYVYVGDNPGKDFKAPNELGWLTIGVLGCQQNIHAQSTDRLAAIYHPALWIPQINVLCEFLC